MNRLYLILFLLINLCATPISYEEVLELTYENSKKLKDVEFDIKANEMDLKAVESTSLGSIEFINEVTRTNHAGHVFNSKLSSREATFEDFGFAQMNQGLKTVPTDLNKPKDRTNINSSVSYNIPLFTGFKLTTQEKILSLKKRALNFKSKLTKKSLQFEVLKAYNSAVVAKQYILAISKAKESVQFLVTSANEFYKEGLVTKLDKKQAMVRLYNINSKLIESKNNFQLALAYLKYLTGKNSISDVFELKKITQKNYDLNTLTELAYENRDDLSIYKTQKDLLQKNIALNRSDYYPIIYAHMQYGVNDDTYTLSEDKDYYLLSIGLRYKLFDDSRKYAYEKSRVLYNKSINSLEELREGIKLEVEKQYLEASSKKKLLAESKQSLELSSEILQQAKLMYKNQLISMTDLLKHEASFRISEASFISSKYEYALSLAKLELTLGKNLQKRE